MSPIIFFLIGITVVALTVGLLALFNIPKIKADGRK